MILGGSERYGQGKDWSKMVLKLFFFHLMAVPMHITGRLKKKLDFNLSIRLIVMMNSAVQFSVV